MMFIFNVAALLLGALTVVGCASTPRADMVLHEGPEGGVYLERIAERHLEAAHPIKLERALIERVLNGVHIGQPKSVMQALFADHAKPDRVFANEDSAFLAPLISSALSQARADQQVRFRVVHLASPIAHPSGGGAAVGSSGMPASGPQRETTSGTLYAHGLTLHVRLDEYRHRTVKPDVISGPNRYYPDTTGLDDREVQFIPETALRPDSYKADGHTLAIDYESLGKRPQMDLATSTKAPASVAVHTATPTQREALAQSGDQTSTPHDDAKAATKTEGDPEEVQPLKDLIVKKDMELETLKKELRSLRRQLSERDAQLDALRKKTKPTQKPPNPLP